MSERLRLDIDTESYKRLMAIAVEQRRPIAWQAEVLLMQAIAEHFLPMLRPDPLEVEPVGVSEKSLGVGR